MDQNFTPRGREVMKIAEKEAIGLGLGYVNTEHILLALAKIGGGVAEWVFKEMNVDLVELRKQVENEGVSDPDETPPKKNLPLTGRAKNNLLFAREEADNFKSPVIGTEHILLGLLRDQESVAGQILSKFGLKTDQIRELALEFLQAGEEYGKNPSEREDLLAKQISKKSKLNRWPSLSTFGTRLDIKKDDFVSFPFYDSKIDELTKVLIRRWRNNAILVGPMDLKECEIVTGLVYRIEKGAVPPQLQQMKIIELEASKVIGGTTSLRAVEDRLEGVKDECIEQENLTIILNGSQWRNFAGRSWTENASFQSLLSASHRSDFRIVLSWPYEEYSILSEDTKTKLARVGTLVDISANRPELIRDIILDQTSKLESHYRCKIDELLIDHCLELVDSFLDPPIYPQLVLDILDSACASVSYRPQPDTSLMESKIEGLKKEKHAAVIEQRFEDAESIRKQLEKMKRQLDELVITSVAKDSIENGFHQVTGVKARKKRPSNEYISAPKLRPN